MLGHQEHSFLDHAPRNRWFLKTSMLKARRESIGKDFRGSGQKSHGKDIGDQIKSSARQMHDLPQWDE